MGCDIHCSLETYNKSTNKWEEVALYYKDERNNFRRLGFYNERDYELFSVLAGVRGSHNSLVHQRGVPEDMSDTIAERYYTCRGDWHSATWYDYCELRAYANSNNDNIVEVNNDTGEKYNILSNFMQCVDFVLNVYQIWYPKPNDVRIIIWFDS